MSYICKSYLYTVADIYYLIIRTWNDASNCAVSILHCIYGLLILYVAASFSLPALPLSFLHLYVSTVAKHDGAKIGTWFSHEYLASETFCIE